MPFFLLKQENWEIKNIVLSDTFILKLKESSVVMIKPSIELFSKLRFSAVSLGWHLTLKWSMRIHEHCVFKTCVTKHWKLATAACNFLISAATK